MNDKFWCHQWKGEQFNHVIWLQRLALQPHRCQAATWVSMSSILRQLEIQEPYDSTVLLRKRWEMPSSLNIWLHLLVLFEQILKHFKIYPFQRDIDCPCFRSSLHRNVANLLCESFLSRLLEAISLNVSWFISPFRICLPLGSPLQFSSSLEKNVLFWRFGHIWFSCYCISWHTLPTALWTNFSEWEMREKDLCIWKKFNFAAYELEPSVRGLLGS